MVSLSPLLLLLTAGAAAVLAQDNVTIDDTSPYITYLPSPDAWTALTNQAAPTFNGTLHYSNSTLGLGVMFNFTGTSFQWYYLRKPDRGVLTVTFDGEILDQSLWIDQFAETEDTELQMIEYSPLEDRAHSFLVQNEPSDSRILNGGVIPYMAVDQLMIAGTLPPLPAAAATSSTSSSSSTVPSPSPSTQSSAQSSGQSSGGNQTQAGLVPASSPVSNARLSSLSTPALAGVITGSVVAFAAVALLASWVARRSVAANTPEGQRKWHQHPRYGAGGAPDKSGFDFADADAKSIDEYSISVQGGDRHDRGGGKLEMRPYPGGGGTPAPAYYPAGAANARSPPQSNHGHAESEDGHGGGGYDRTSVAPSAFSGQGGGGLGVPQTRAWDARGSAAPSSFYSRTSSIYPDERLRDSTQPPMPGQQERDSRYTDGGWSERYSTASASTAAGGGGGLHRRTGSGASRDMAEQGMSIGERARGRWLYGGTP